MQKQQKYYIIFFFISNFRHKFFKYIFPICFLSEKFNMLTRWTIQQN
ncbi:hypothetical protein pb186bvf_004579 [Paramecium bursaria]